MASARDGGLGGLREVVALLYGLKYLWFASDRQGTQVHPFTEMLSRNLW
jgi:hypothetical protein